MEIKKPHFELTSVHNDGSIEEPQIVPINEMPLDTNTNRRGFLGAGLVAGVALSIFGKSISFANSYLNKKLPKSAEEKILFAHCDYVTSLSITPDNKFIISSSNDNTIKIWGCPDGKLIKTLKGHTGPIKTSFIDGDGSILISGSQDKTIKLWSLPNGELIKTIEEYSANDFFATLCISPDGKFLAAGTGDNDIKLWSVSTGKVEKLLKGHSGDILQLCFSPDSKMLISGSYDNTIKLWALPEANLIKTLKGHSHWVSELVLSSDGKTLVSGSYDGTIKIWSLPGGVLKKTMKAHSSEVANLIITHDDKTILSASSDKTVKIWALPKLNLLKSVKGFDVGDQSLCISNNDKIFISSSPLSDMIRVWSLPERKLIATFKGNVRHNNTLSISSDSKILISSAGFERSVSLWDLERKEFIGFLFDPTCNEVNGVSYNIYDQITGTIKTYTLPCGSPIPSGATCTCNCVAGTYKPTPTYRTPSTICTCNQVCTCVPVCQAHKLLHPDKFVRSLSREILLFMGSKETEYMNWAADNSKARLGTAIRSVIKEIKRGIKPDYEKWPSVIECQQYLKHNDEVISVMAAQMVNLQCNLRKQMITEDMYQKVESLLAKSEEMHWKNKS